MPVGGKSPDYRPIPVYAGYTFANEVKVTFSDSGAVSTGIIQSDGTLRATGDGVTAKSDVMIGDVNGDGKIDVTDVTLIQKYVAEIIDHF